MWLQKKIQYGFVDIDNNYVRIIDTPGFGGIDEDNFTNCLINLNKEIIECAKCDGILYIINGSNRLTQIELIHSHTLKEFLDKNVDLQIIVCVTHIDQINDLNNWKLKNESIIYSKLHNCLKIVYINNNMNKKEIIKFIWIKKNNFNNNLNNENKKIYLNNTGINTEKASKISENPNIVLKNVVEFVKKDPLWLSILKCIPGIGTIVEWVDKLFSNTYLSSEYVKK
jgi:L-cysteine desulfidase